MPGTAGSSAWRALTETDLDALEMLEAACRQADGEISVSPPAYRQVLDTPDVWTLCASPIQAEPVAGGPDSAIAAAGWMQPGKTQIQLYGKVHPGFRRKGLGTDLLRRLEEQARQLRQPAPLIIRNEALNAGSAALYERLGYSRDFLELWMERDLSQALPVMTGRFEPASWTAANAVEFFEVYGDAFRERPGFRSIPAANWIADYTGDPDFRPDVSLLARVEGAAVGFVTSGINPLPTRAAPSGWISQVGVRPALRGRGAAAWLIVHVMQAFRREGFTALGLHVNSNNPGAIRLYERLGFRVIGQRARYSRAAEPDRSWIP